MKVNPKILILVGAALIGSLALAASQGAASGGDPWWYAEVFWPNFVVFLIPFLLGVALIEACERFFLPAAGDDFARRWTWAAFGSRVAFIVVVPVMLLLWGYPSNRNLHGLVELDAVNANDTAWHAAVAGAPVLESWKRAPGDNTGGITVMGVAVFRLFSPDQNRTLLLGLVASFFTSLTVIAVYRLGNGLFSNGVARIAAVAAAVYPEAVMIGSSHQQMGYLALVYGVILLAAAGVMIKKESTPEASALPKRRNAAILLVLFLVVLFLLSSQFFKFGLIGLAAYMVWLADPKRRVGRIIWIAGGAAVLALVVLRVLSILDIVPGNWDFLFKEYQYLYGLAWDEFYKMTLAGGGDLFQNVLAGMEKGPAFALAAAYGTVQPVLPAAIGHRSVAAQGGFFWQLLGIYRGLGWYLVLPLLIYGTLKSLRGILARKPEAILMLVFWFIAVIGSYRAFGDQWDNPRYRLFALAPMALLAAWAWITQRETRDPWFPRIAIPFGTATAALTVWYFLRDYALVDFATVPSILVIGIITALAFVLGLFLVRTKKSAPAG
jgi:4-amino-4-deoxy-L-arabinose transferase-like glycosyltransferase